MTMLSPAATFHAELRQQLGGVGRALSAQRALVWLSRGLALGSIVVLGVVIWAWVRGTVGLLPVPLLAAGPVGLGLLFAAVSLLRRHDTRELARRVDRAAKLHERSTTALELGARGQEFPLAVAQMRDAVEHLRRVDLLDAFPLRVPRNEVITTFFVAVVAVLVGVSPNPWLLQARASNPAITVAREEAQRVQRLADSMQGQDSAETEQLRQIVSQGAKTIDARSNEPDAALNALQDLEDQIRQMSAGDDQLSAALAAIASALASDPATQQLASAINTGDLREISRATRDLAQQSDQMSGQDKARVAKVLRSASQSAQRASQSVANNLSAAADAMQASAGADSSSMANADSSGQQASADGQSAQSAQDALNQLSNSAAAAADRQRAGSQLESSRNALERALGRTQSRSGSGNNGRSSTSSSSASSQSANGQQGQSSNGQSADAGQTNGQGQGSGDSGSNSASPGDDGSNGQSGEGSGYSTGGQGQDHTGADSSLDVITRPEQVPSNGAAQPNESSVNPYLAQGANGSAHASEESVQPSYSGKPTQGNDSASIPLGLRDLVKDYFSSLDQNQK